MAQHKVIALTATMPIFFIDVPIKKKLLLILKYLILLNLKTIEYD